MNPHVIVRGEYWEQNLSPKKAVGARVMPPTDIHIPDVDFNEPMDVLAYMAKGS